MLWSSSPANHTLLAPKALAVKHTWVVIRVSLPILWSNLKTLIFIFSHLKINNFFDYYLPVLIKIIGKYDEVENQKLKSKEGKEFLEKADKMIADTKKAFSTILDSLYQNDIMDADAEMKVYNTMLKADGIVDDNPIMKGSDDDEE